MFCKRNNSEDQKCVSWGHSRNWRQRLHRQTPDTINIMEQNARMKTLKHLVSKNTHNSCSITIKNDNGRLISMRHEHISPQPRPKRADESDCRLSNGLEMWRHALWASSCLSIQCRVLLERQTSRAVSFFAARNNTCCSNFKLKSSSEWSKDPLKIYSCSCPQI